MRLSYISNQSYKGLVRIFSLTLLLMGGRGIMARMEFVALFDPEEVKFRGVT